MFLFLDYCFDNETDYAGGDIEHFFDIQNPEDCQVECQSDPRCEYWSYAHYDHANPAKTCYFKSSKGQVIQNNILTSGPKYCQGNMETRKKF